MNINFHIQHLVVDGVPLSRNQELEFRASIISHLNQQISESRAKITTSQSRINAGNVNLSGHSRGVELGEKVASAIIQGITQ